MARGKGAVQTGDGLVSKNRRAFFDYEIEDTLEAGLALIGSEVRSLRTHSADLTDAWIDIDRRGEAWVKSMRIPRLQHAAFGHDDERPRKLLLRREQIERLRGLRERDGMTLIATKCYFKNNRAKLEVAVARGKKKHDKRQAIKTREADREARAAMRRGRSAG
ncbi:MAG TPA: SsrA-binding protein SmpB [Polyangiaceae bacterium]|nr:SsrA-binding protein SmpB [Polyangiaceae bacterium]